MPAYTGPRTIDGHTVCELCSTDERGPVYHYPPDAHDRHVLKRIRAEANEDFWKQRTDTIRDYVTRASEGDTYKLIDYLVFLEQWISRIAGENRG